MSRHKRPEVDDDADDDYDDGDIVHDDDDEEDEDEDVKMIDQQEVGVVSTTVLSIVYTFADVCKQLLFFVPNYFLI